MYLALNKLHAFDIADAWLLIHSVMEYYSLFAERDESDGIGEYGTLVWIAG